ncbi:Kelch-like protein 26 [Nibea albiflora]|uniref:Kelch-like protein 26 n=1 Tax=Nibea albiflora TaxID=240163 RepID=A0ACB7ELN2_NIBAL|nr:Kelch-like protein 26 [Nibea albiflora]
MAESDGGDFASKHPQNSMANKNSTLRCTFSAPSHSATLLQGLSVLRAQGQLLDVVLAVNEERFQVHKAVLAACSDYFRAMFTGGMRESNQDTIELKGLSARGLKHIIDFAYSAEVTLDLDCIQDVLGAAVFLQMVPVWTYVEPLKRRIWGHAGTPCGEKLYISGGYGVSLDDKKTLHCYDPASDQWDFRAPMNEPRVLHAMISNRDRVYALGGRMDHVDRCFDVLAVEYYIPENDQWTTVSPMRAGQSEAGCCLLDRKIYIVGGYNWHLNNVTSIVQVYNTETDEWERDLHFPESFAGIACTPIIIPQNTTQR